MILVTHPTFPFALATAKLIADFIALCNDSGKLFWLVFLCTKFSVILIVLIFNHNFFIYIF